MTYQALSVPWDLRTVSKLRPWFSSPSLKIVFNGPFDIPRIRRAGVPIRGPYWDVMFAAQLIDPDAPGYSLNEVASFYLHLERWKHKGNPGSKPKPPKVQTWKKPQDCGDCGIPTSKGKRVDGVRVCVPCLEAAHERAMGKWREEAKAYGRNDSFYLLPIYRKQVGELRRTGQRPVFDTMMRALPVLIEMQEEGIRVDPPVRDRIAHRYTRWAEWADATWSTLSGGCNPRSPKQLMRLLYEDWALPVQYREEKVGGERQKKPTTEQAALEALKDVATGAQRTAIRVLLHARHYRKWAETYAAIGDWVYPGYAPETKDEGTGKSFRAGAATGRIIAKGNTLGGTKTPPIQQIPKPLRRMFIPSQEGSVLIEADYGSQELRIAAYLSGDLGLIRAIERGEDIHHANSEAMGIDRTRAKNLFYGAIFGGTGRAVQRAMRAQGYDISQEEVSTAIGIIRSLYPRVFQWHSELLTFVRRHGWIANPFGRRRYFFDPKRSYNEILNFPVQSVGADILWTIVPDVAKAATGVGGRLVALVHDSVLCEVPSPVVSSFITSLKGVMEREWREVAPGFRVPVDVKTGSNWGF